MTGPRSRTSAASPQPPGPEVGRKPGLQGNQRWLRTRTRPPRPPQRPPARHGAPAHPATPPGPPETPQAGTPPTPPTPSHLTTPPPQPQYPLQPSGTGSGTAVGPGAGPPSGPQSQGPMSAGEQGSEGLSGDRCSGSRGLRRRLLPRADRAAARRATSYWYQPAAAACGPQQPTASSQALSRSQARNSRARSRSRHAGHAAPGRGCADVGCAARCTANWASSTEDPGPAAQRAAGQSGAQPAGGPPTAAQQAASAACGSTVNGRCTADSGGCRPQLGQPSPARPAAKPGNHNRGNRSHVLHSRVRTAGSRDSRAPGQPQGSGQPVPAQPLLGSLGLGRAGAGQCAVCSSRVSRRVAGRAGDRRLSRRPQFGQQSSQQGGQQAGPQAGAQQGGRPAGQQGSQQRGRRTDSRLEAGSRPGRTARWAAGWARGGQAGPRGGAQGGPLASLGDLAYGWAVRRGRGRQGAGAAGGQAPQAGSGAGKVLDSPVGRAARVGKVLGRLVEQSGCTVLGRPVGKVLGRCPGRLARKQVVRVLRRTPAATALGRTWVGTVLVRLGSLGRSRCWYGWGASGGYVGGVKGGIRAGSVGWGGGVGGGCLVTTGLSGAGFGPRRMR